MESWILILWFEYFIYFVDQIVPALAIGSSSSWIGFYVPLTYPPSAIITGFYKCFLKELPYLKKKKKVYLFWERQREHKLGRGREKRENPKRVPCSAWSLTQGQIPQLWDHDWVEVKNLMPNWLSQPGAPEFPYFLTVQDVLSYLIDSCPSKESLLLQLENGFRNQIWVLCVLIAAGVSLLVGRLLLRNFKI